METRGIEPILLTGWSRFGVSHRVHIHQVNTIQMEIFELFILLKVCIIWLKKKINQ